MANWDPEAIKTQLEYLEEVRASRKKQQELYGDDEPY